VARLRSSVAQWSAAIALAVAVLCNPTLAQSTRIETLQALGEALFADRNLSFSRKQNCVSCHSPELAFTDPRQLGAIQGAVSRGGDGHSLGDRNAPTLAYAARIPRFHFAATGEPEGGLFHDGRAAGLEEQAVAPLTNPVEMAMPDPASVVARVKENPAYVDAFGRLFGAGTLDDIDKAYWGLGLALAALERTAQFMPFDSRYDRALRGEQELTDREKAGRDLFFSDAAGCSRCHLQSRTPSASEIFSNARYYNLGVPPNKAVRAVNGKAVDFVDAGLADNPRAGASPDAPGSFRVPTLRNVAVTGPYMHNGVFQDLRTAIAFHQRFNGTAMNNPETAMPWDAPESTANLATGAAAPAALTEDQIGALMAFLEALTDKRYEHLLAKP